MTNATALEKARALAEGDLPAFMITNRIAAALKRAYADGMDEALGYLDDLNGYAKVQRLHKEADQLEGKY